MTREEAIKELELIAQVTMWNDRREAVDMAIEALTAPQTDLISRADAIESVEGLTKYMEKLVEGAEKFPEAHTKNYKHDMEQQIMGVAHASQVILELPSAEAEWIPCSERLPEDGVAVLTTTENEEVYIDQVITDPFKERYFQSNTAYDNFQVIAWMPLPKPYKESEVKE